MVTDKIISKESLENLCIEIHKPIAAVLDVLLDGTQKIVKSEKFDEEESYAIVGEGYVPVGYYFPWAKTKLRVKQNELSLNTLYAFFPIRSSFLGRGKFDPPSDVKSRF